MCTEVSRFVSVFPIGSELLRLGKVVGGSNFSLNVSTNSLRASQCTSIPILQDKSNYWYPVSPFELKSAGEFNRSHRNASHAILAIVFSVRDYSTPLGKKLPEAGFALCLIQLGQWLFQQRPRQSSYVSDF